MADSSAVHVSREWEQTCSTGRRLLSVTTHWRYVTKPMRKVLLHCSCLQLLLLLWPYCWPLIEWLTLFNSFSTLGHFPQSRSNFYVHMDYRSRFLFGRYSFFNPYNKLSDLFTFSHFTERLRYVFVLRLEYDDTVAMYQYCNWLRNATFLSNYFKWMLCCCAVIQLFEATSGKPLGDGKPIDHKVW